MEPTLEQACKYLDRVRNLRGLGLQLEFPTSVLNGLDDITDYNERRVKFFSEWHRLKLNFSWTALRDALHAPQLQCFGVASEISEKIDHSHLTKQGSTDSAVSVSSPMSASPLPSSGSLPLKGQ